MRVGVTGHKGFIASHLIPLLKSSGCEVATLDDYEYYATFVKDCDVVVHLAGCNRGSHDEMIRTNVDMTLQIADLCYRYKKKLIFAGTFYGKKDSYRLTKEIASDIVYSYYSNLNADFYVFLIPRVLGKGCKPFYNSFVTTMIYQHAKGDMSYKDKIQNADDYCDFIWVEDLCEEIYDAIKNNNRDRYDLVENVFSVSLKDIVNILENKQVYAEALYQALKFLQLKEYYKTYDITKN